MATSVDQDEVTMTQAFPPGVGICQWAVKFVRARRILDVGEALRHVGVSSRELPRAPRRPVRKPCASRSGAGGTSVMSGFRCAIGPCESRVWDSDAQI